MQNADGEAASVSDAIDWRDAYGLSFEVLADSERLWVESWGDASGGRFDQHSYTVIDRDGIVTWHAEEYSVGRLDEITNAVEAIE